MSQNNNKYKRLEALLSDVIPVDPDPVVRAEGLDAGAVKQNIAEPQEVGEGSETPAQPEVSPVEVKSSAAFESELSPIAMSVQEPSPVSHLPGGFGAAISGFLKRFGQFRIQARLTALILVTTIPVLIGVTALVGSEAGTRIETDANNNLRQNTNAMVSSLGTWIELNVISLQEMALQPDILSMQPDRQVPVLQSMAKTHPYMYLVSTTNLAGMNVARNDTAKMADYSDRIWYKNALAGEPVTFQSLIGKTSGKPALVVSTPIRDQYGTIIGIGMFAADLTSLSEETRVATIGKTGYIYIVDANNMVLAHPDPAMTEGELRDLSAYPPVAALRRGETGLINFVDENGVSWRAYVSTLDNGWGIITQQQEAEILAPVSQFQGTAILFTALGVTVMLALSWFFIRRTLQPIGALTNAASAIAAGDLNREIQVKSRDELGLLGSTFNDMTSRLRSMIGTLEARVQDRTHDLELAVEVGRTITERVANLQDMLTTAAEMIRARFNLYYAQVYLVDTTGKYLTLRAGTGDVGKELLRRNHFLPFNSGSLNGRAATDRKTVIVEDTSLNPTFRPNPLLPKTRSEMAIPLMAAGQVIGVLDVQSENAGALNAGNLASFEALAGQLSVAIQNANLFAQSQEARQQVEANVRRTSATGWQDFLNSVDRSERLGYLYDQNETVTVSDLASADAATCQSFPVTVTGAEIGQLQTSDENHVWTEQDREILEATAERLGQHIEGLRLLAQAEHYRDEAEQAVRQLTREGWDSYLNDRQEVSTGFFYDRSMVRPLKDGKNSRSASALSQSLMVRDEAVGALEVDFETKPDGADEILQAVANQLSSHIENLRLSELNEKRTQEMETVAELSATTSTVLDPDQLLQTIVDNTKLRFGIYHSHIYLTNDAWQILILTAGAGEIGRKLVAQEHTIPMDADKSLVARSARERKAVIVNDVRSDPGFLANPDLPETRAEMAVPMIVGDKVLGVFDVQSDRVNGFSDEDASIYTTLASQVAIALQNARLYAEQAATVTKLRELDRLKSAFLANMSHELRTPLNSILGFADVILEELDGPLTATMANDLNLIQKNGQHLLHLINDVLDMAKIEAGRMNLAPEKFKVHEVMDEVVSITSNLASDKNISLILEEKDDQEIEIFADRTRIRQVMINLVNNSIKFTDDGRVLVRTTRLDGDKVLIAVKDSGIGIPQDQLETIFQEFTQVDISSTRKTGGTGLGLPISRRLIEMHGGRLWAESSGVAGEGSTFYVELPLEARITDTIEKQEK